MIFCKELDKGFESKKELFNALKGVKKELILSKKATIKQADGVSMPSILNTDTSKGQKEEVEVNYGSVIYPVINTTLLMDSHEDVHLNGIWNKSVKEQKGKVSLIINHDFKVGSVISFPDEVEPMVQELTWKELGFEYTGKTEALIFKSKLTEDSNQVAYGMYKRKRPVQHSISMQYVDISLAVDSDEEDWKEEKATWNKYFKSIVNPEMAEKNGYFWAVKEAKIYKEGSMVLEGSNWATPTRYSEAGKSTSNVPGDPTRLKQLNKLLELTKH